MEPNTNGVAINEPNKSHSYWQLRITYSVFLGYAAFYLIRQNCSIAVPQMLDEMKWSKGQVGWAFSAFAIIYGLSKFVTGIICDRVGVRYLMTLGLLGAGLCNIGIGLTNSLPVFCVIWMLNGFFQSMGWPSVSRSLTQWFSGKQLGTRWGIVNSSCQFGTLIAYLLGAWLITRYNWHHAFIIPGLFCCLLAFWLFERLRESPKALGLTSPESSFAKVKSAPEADCSGEEVLSPRELIIRYILPNKSLWCLAIAIFFIYVIRVGFFSWAPTFIKETRHVSIENAAFQSSILEFAGFISGILLGWASGRLFSGRRGILCAFCLLGLGSAIATFYYTSSLSPFLYNCLWFSIGFLAYGSMTLLGLLSAEFGFKKAAATAAGFTGFFGYIGSAVSGTAVGYIVDNWGWGSAIMLFMVSAIMSAIFCFCSELLRKPQNSNK